MKPLAANIQKCLYESRTKFEIENLRVDSEKNWSVSFRSNVIEDFVVSEEVMVKIKDKLTKAIQGVP